MTFPLALDGRPVPLADEATVASSLGDLDPEAFRRVGIQLVQHIADYLAHIESSAVRSTVAPGEILRYVPPHAPDQAEPLEQIVADALSLLSATTHWQAPGYMAYFAVTRPSWVNCSKRRSTPHACSGRYLRLPPTWSN